MIGSLHQTIERWQNLKGQELPIATKCFVTFTFGPPPIFPSKQSFGHGPILNTRLFESSSLHWKKKSKDKNKNKKQNRCKSLSHFSIAVAIYFVSQLKKGPQNIFFHLALKKYSKIVLQFRPFLLVNPVKPLWSLSHVIAA